MQCPNCKTDLVQVNGRYICSDCGCEVPESEVNIGDWGQGSFGGGSVIPEPVLATVDDGEMPVDMAEDYIDQSVEPSNHGRAYSSSDNNRPDLSDKIAEDDPLVKAEAADDSHDTPEDGFYTSGNPALAVDLEALKSSLAEPVKKDVVLEKPSDEVLINVANNNINVDDLAPVNDSGIVLPTSSLQISPDAELYEDPLYDIPDTEVKTESVEVKKERPQKNPNKEFVIGLFIVGGIASLSLIIGGIYGYSKLTSTDNVVSSKVKVVDSAIDCDNSTKKDSCVLENFGKCVANTAWTSDYQDKDALIETLGYQINGIVDNSCEIKITGDKSTDNSKAVGKSMVCSLDNSLTIDKAKNTMSLETCSGDLANILFASN